MALVRNPYIVEAIKQADYDVVSHGYRWLHYQETDLEVEKQHMEQALSVLENLFGNKTIGWYTGRDSPNTRQLLAEFRKFNTTLITMVMTCLLDHTYRYGGCITTSSDYSLYFGM